MGQHGQAVLSEVRRGPSPCRVRVQLGRRAHEEGDIGDVYPHLIAAIRARLDVDSVVQVPGLGFWVKAAIRARLDG